MRIKKVVAASVLVAGLAGPAIAHAGDGHERGFWQSVYEMFFGDAWDSGDGFQPGRHTGTGTGTR